MDQKLKRALSLVGKSDGRPDFDFYPTPTSATTALLAHESFPGSIWEPACGDGAISKILIEHGMAVTSTDLVDRGFGEGGVDFLTTPATVQYDHIITNPPYALGEKFALTALSRSRSKVAMLCKLAFLEGAKRKSMFETTPLKRVLVFSKRLSMTRNGLPMKNSGMIAFAWFIWEHDYRGAPSISWV